MAVSIIVMTAALAPAPFSVGRDMGEILSIAPRISPMMNLGMNLCDPYDLVPDILSGKAQ